MSRVRTGVAEMDIVAVAVQAIPPAIHGARDTEALVAVRWKGASRMVHSATTTATYQIQILSTARGLGGTA